MPNLLCKGVLFEVKVGTLRALETSLATPRTRRFCFVTRQDPSDD